MLNCRCTRNPPNAHRIASCQRQLLQVQCILQLVMGLVVQGHCGKAASPVTRCRSRLRRTTARHDLVLQFARSCSVRVVAAPSSANMMHHRLLRNCRAPFAVCVTRSTLCAQDIRIAADCDASRRFIAVLQAPLGWSALALHTTTPPTARLQHIAVRRMSGYFCLSKRTRRELRARERHNTLAGTLAVPPQIALWYPRHVM